MFSRYEGEEGKERMEESFEKGQVDENCEEDAEAQKEERVLRYHYDRRAWEMIKEATALFRKVAACPDLEPIDLISIAKVIQILEDMPLVPPIDGSLGVTVGFPGVKDGDNTTGLYLAFDIQDGDITLSYSGHTYDPAVGGDSFSCRRLQLWAGDEADFMDNMDRCLWVPGVVGLQEAVESLDISAGVDLDVTDDEDPFREAYLAG